jgi:hypothetical protein
MSSRHRLGAGTAVLAVTALTAACGGPAEPSAAAAAKVKLVDTTPAASPT